MLASTWELVGKRIGNGRYRLTTRLGEGGMGTVYRASDTSLGIDVVIKIPRRSLLEEVPEFRERFALEIRSLVQLAHPHVVRILDVGEHEGVPFVVMQLLDGGSLAERRRCDAQGRPLPLSPFTLHAWLLPVAQALDFIHVRGYIHRDIKPANILFDRHALAYVSDFGLAKVFACCDGTEVSRQTRTGLVLGTPHYMAPELVLGQACDGRADQYALAVMVHELLSCEMPIDAPSPAAVLVQQISEAPRSLCESLPRIAPELASTVLRGLAKSPAERYASCTAFAEAALAAVGALAKPDEKPIVTIGRVTRSDDRRIGCPSCGKLIGVTDKSRGKRTWCPGCQVVFQIAPDLTELREIVEARPLTCGPTVNAQSTSALSTNETLGDKEPFCSPAATAVAPSTHAAQGTPVHVERRWRRALVVSACLLIAGVQYGIVAWRERPEAFHEPVIVAVQPVLKTVGPLTIQIPGTVTCQLELTNATEVGKVRYEWASPPPLPAELNPETGLVSLLAGSPTASGNHTFQLRAVQVSSDTPSEPLTLGIEVRPPPPLQLATLDVRPQSPQFGEPVQLTIHPDASENRTLVFEYRFGPQGTWQALPARDAKLGNLPVGRNRVQVRAKHGELTSTWLEQIVDVVPIVSRCAHHPLQPQVGDPVRLEVITAPAAIEPVRYEWRSSTQTAWATLPGDQLVLPAFPAGEFKGEFRVVCGEVSSQAVPLAFTVTAPTTTPSPSPSPSVPNAAQSPQVIASHTIELPSITKRFPTGNSVQLTVPRFDSQQVKLRLANPDAKHSQGGVELYQIDESAQPPSWPIVAKQKNTRSIVADVVAVDNGLQFQWRESVNPIVAGSLRNCVFHIQLGNAEYRWALRRPVTIPPLSFNLKNEFYSVPVERLDLLDERKLQIEVLGVGERREPLAIEKRTAKWDQPLAIPVQAAGAEAIGIQLQVVLTIVNKSLQLRVRPELAKPVLERVKVQAAPVQGALVELALPTLIQAKPGPIPQVPCIEKQVTDLVNEAGTAVTRCQNNLLALGTTIGFCDQRILAIKANDSIAEVQKTPAIQSLEGAIERSKKGKAELELELAAWKDREIGLAKLKADWNSLRETLQLSFRVFYTVEGTPVSVLVAQQ